MSTQGLLGFTVWANRLPERAMSDRHGGRSDTAAMNYENLCPLYLPPLPTLQQPRLGHNPRLYLRRLHDPGLRRHRPRNREPLRQRRQRPTPRRVLRGNRNGPRHHHEPADANARRVHEKGG